MLPKASSTFPDLGQGSQAGNPNVLCSQQNVVVGQAQSLLPSNQMPGSSQLDPFPGIFSSHAKLVFHGGPHTAHFDLKMGWNSKFLCQRKEVYLHIQPSSLWV